LAAIIQTLDQRQAEARKTAGTGSASDDPTLSLPAAERQAAEAKTLLAQLDGLDPAGLSHQEDLSREVLRFNAWVTINQPPQFWFSSPLMPSTGSPLTNALTGAPDRTFTNGADLSSYLADLDRLVGMMAAALAKERERADRGIILPDEQIDRVLTYLESFAATSATSPFAVNTDRLKAIAPDAAATFRGAVATRIDTLIAPAGQALRALLVSLAPKAPNAVGWALYPGGKEAYRIATRQMTTLDVTPEQVHQLGLEFVADTERQMAELRTKIGFKGTRTEFHDQLRRDQRFYVKTPQEVGAVLMSHIRRIEPHVSEFFTRSPEALYGVTRLNPALEPSQTYGFYSIPSSTEPRGLYNFNGSKLEDRSLLAGAALIFHELVPGHHFQVSLQMENNDLPAFRRSGMSAGYTEGWGEYSSSVVAREMGMYQDPYDLYGRLVFDNFFNVRLVVDTGMNYFGWSRPKAMLYMREHTLESDVQIDSETIRYSIRQPAQALAYRMGRQTFVRLREKATTQLGARFDIRRFHDAVLSVGSMPLFVLERHIDWWIRQEQAREELE
ncbi:MAG: DUF885 domain-containing protein, partial [Vicinamibacterales bacterium]